MAKIIGTTTTYTGTYFRFMSNTKVRIRAIFRDYPNGEDCEIIDDPAFDGPVLPTDRVEVQPWIAQEKRFSFVTSDPYPSELACFAGLEEAA